MKILSVAFLFVLANLLPAQAATPLSSLPAKTIDGAPLELPAQLPQCPVLLVVGFSRAASKPAQAWTHHLHRYSTCDTGLAVYQAVVIEDIPRLFRGMAVRSIRKSLPDALRPVS